MANYLKRLVAAVFALELRDDGGSIENPSTNLATAEALWFDGGNVSESGSRVTVESALRHSTAWACILCLTETIASLPLPVLKRAAKTNGKEVAHAHPLYRTLHDAPNPFITSFTFWQTLVAMCLIYGDGYALIAGDTKRRELYLLHSPSVKPVMRNDGLYYEVRSPDGTSVAYYPADEIIRIPGLSLNGYTGISTLLRAARESIGLAIAAETHSGKFFANGARVGGVLSTDGVLDKAARDRIKEAWKETQAGVANAYKTAVLEQGLRYQPIGMQSDHAQLLETRRFQVEEVCRVFRVPPVFAGDYTRSTFSNTEQQDLHFAKHTITPWCVKIERELNLKLFANDPTHFTEFNLDGLQRGDFQARVNGSARGIQSAMFTPNEVRGWFNLPPMEGGDQLYLQQNMAGADAVANGEAGNTTGNAMGDDEGKQPRRGMVPLFERRGASVEDLTEVMAPLFAQLAEVLQRVQPGNAPINLNVVVQQPRRSITTVAHDEDGNITRSETRHDLAVVQVEQVQESVKRVAHDGNGNVTRVETDNG